VNNDFKRRLGLIDATSIVSGSMIGSGIFIVSAYMMRDVGSVGWILVLWAVTGLITLMAALSYGELAAMMPEAGGQYVYIKRAYGDKLSFLYGWTVFSVIQTGVIAAVAVAFAKYAAVFFTILDDAAFKLWGFVVSFGQLVAVGSVIILTYSNTRGVENGKFIQLLFTGAKFIALFVLIFYGIYLGLGSDTFSKNFTDVWDTTGVNGNVGETLSGFALIGVLGATIINSLFSSDAWNNVTFIAGEIKDPKRNLPRSLILGTLIVTATYLLCNIAYLCLLPAKGDSSAVDPVLQLGIMHAAQDRVGAAAAYVMFGNVGVLFMAALIMVSTFGCNNGLILSGSRLFYAMSKDGLFFKRASKLNSAGVPAVSLWVQCAWACVLCLSGKYSDLLVYSTFASLLFYILTILAVVILRKKDPDVDRPYKLKGYPFIPVLYCLITLFICIDLVIYDWKNTGIGILIVLLGLPVYYFTQKKAND